MPIRQKRWRVRVKRTVEDWVDVEADDVLQAEKSALNIPGVVSVLSGVTMRGDKPIMGQFTPIGVEDPDD